MPSNVGHQIRDPGLTLLGHEQARALGSLYPETFDEMRRSKTLLVSSPFRRAMHTALDGFASVLAPQKAHVAAGSNGSIDVAHLLDGCGQAVVPRSIMERNKRTKLVALAALQEDGSWPSDTGSSVASLRREFDRQVPRGAAPIDWSDLKPGWNENKGFYAASEEQLMERGKGCRHWIREQPFDLVVVVTHHGVLRAMMEKGRQEVSTTCGQRTEESAEQEPLVAV